MGTPHGAAVRPQIPVKKTAAHLTVLIRAVKIRQVTRAFDHGEFSTRQHRAESFGGPEPTRRVEFARQHQGRYWRQQ